jgi:hypothetical protein
MNHRGLLRLIIVIVLTILFLSACSAPAMIPYTATPSSVPPTAINTFPSGWFDCNDCGPNLTGYTTRYSDDETLIVYDWGREELTGKWYTEGDIFITGDTWCHDIETMPASYKWHYDGELLTFELIEDKCPDRIDSMVGKPWKLIEPLPMGTYSAKDGDYILELGDDNSFTFTENGSYITSGTFSQNGNEITWETDLYCDQLNSGKATYTWTFTNNRILFRMKGTDKCHDRMGVYLGVPYVKQQ